MASFIQKTLIVLAIGIAFIAMTILPYYAGTRSSEVVYLFKRTVHFVTSDAPFPYADPRPGVGAELVLAKYHYEHPVDLATGSTDDDSCYLPKSTSLNIIAEVPERGYLVRVDSAPATKSWQRPCARGTVFIVKRRTWAWFADEVNNAIDEDRELRERASDVKNAAEGLPGVVVPSP